MIGYHLTPLENLDGISKSGLRPGIGPRSQEIGEVIEAIYFFPDLVTMEDALASWCESYFDPDKPLVCLLVDIFEVERGTGANFEIVCLSAIDPSRIKILSMDIWEEISFPEPENSYPLGDRFPPEGEICPSA